MRRGQWTLGILAAAGLLAACTPPPPPPPDPTPPTIVAFTAAAARTEAPVTATYSWSISDPNPDLLTCRLDVDSDGSWERTLTPCTNAHLAVANFTAAGDRTATLEVSDGTFPAVTATTVVPVAAGPSESFDIVLRLDPSMPLVYQAAFTAAEARWEQVITAGVPDVYAEIGPIPILADWVTPYAGIVDDVIIDGRSGPIDGSGQVLGRAGAFGSREFSGLPYWGVMEFDEDDLADLAAEGTLDAVILHEMGHVLGVGGTWLTKGLVSGIPLDPRFTGAAANAVWQELSGTTQLVPVEDDGGVGTQWVHWREETFGSELMTGYLGGALSPLSLLTIAGYADLGYGVDFTQADPYSLPGGWSYLRRPGRKLNVEWLTP